MSYRLDAFSDVRLDEALLRFVLDEHRRAIRPRLDTLWTYYRNPLQPVGFRGAAPDSGRWYRLAQEAGLPPRISGRSLSGNDPARRDVVIENDIAWRVQAMVDFMVGKPIKLVSTAPDLHDAPPSESDQRRHEIERILDAVWENSGGIGLLQDAALLGNVFGHVDLLLRIDDEFIKAARRTPERRSLAHALDMIRHLRVELIDPRRGVPILSERDYRTLDAYVIHYDRPNNVVKGASVIERILQRRGRIHNGRHASPNDPAPGASPARSSSTITEIISANAWQVYEDGQLIWERDQPPFSTDLTAGRVPVIHIQNISQPFEYPGLSEVEPLIPMQDELNTRLSDRANRVAMQSFKMYLAKGVSGFADAPITPGTVFSTDNLGASIQSFGGDADSPSESAHITEVREALDKVSGVPPIASGVVRAKIGNLSSANALKITLMGVLSKTARKRITYGRGIAEMSKLILAALDAAGFYHTTPVERTIRLDWPDPLPEDRRETIWAAQAKARLGVPEATVLEDLGEAPTDAGIS